MISGARELEWINSDAYLNAVIAAMRDYEPQSPYTHDSGREDER